MKKFLKATLILALCLSLLLTMANLTEIGVSAESNNGIVFAKWDGVNGSMQWTNPGTVSIMYNDDGSMKLTFTGNSGQPQCIAGLRFNDNIARQALNIALQGSKKLTFTVTYTGGKYSSGTTSLYNQLNVYLNNSTATVKYENANYMRIHTVVLDVSSLNTSTSFSGHVLQILAQNYGGQGFKDAEIIISPITVVPSEAPSPLGFNESAMNFVKGIKVGWNLGNTLENVNPNYINQKTPQEIETLTGNNPVTTQAIIDTVKAAGFNAIRMPVSWMMFVSKQGNDYTINPVWITRVKEVVQYALNRNMYVIVNMHHDDKHWLDISKTGADWEEVKKQYQDLWEIIAYEFRNYDAKLILEAGNEIIYQDDWWGNQTSYLNKVNELYQIFYNVVRNSGGNNHQRYLMFPTYGAQFYEHQMSKLWLPSGDNRVIVDIHWYTTKYEAQDIAWFFNLCNSYFLSKNIPVILGEGGIQRYQPADLKTKWAENFIGYAGQYGIKCFVWDDGGNFKILDRPSLNWVDHAYVHAIMSNSKIDKFFSVNDIPDMQYTGSPLTPSVVVPGLTQGTHYDVYYSNNVNVGKASVFVIGKGSYAGYSSTLYFNITSEPTTTEPDDGYLTLADFEDGTTDVLSKQHYATFTVDNTAGVGGSKAAKISFKKLSYVPNEDTFAISLTPAQVANSVGMRFWIKGDTSDFIRRRLMYYTKHINPNVTERYRTKDITISPDGSYFEIYWGDQATYNIYHDGASSWNYTVPTLEQTQSSLFRIGLSFAVAANTGSQVLYVDNIQLILE